MGTQKKEKQRRIRQNDTKDGNLRVKGENFYRDAKKVKKLSMYKQGRAVRNAKGDIIQAADLQSTDVPTARVDPNRKWFGNTRVIAQDALSHFREAMGDKKDDSYQVLLKRNKLPMSLLDQDKTESPTAKIVETESFASTFGPKQQRKKPRIAASSLEDLMSTAEKDSTTYDEKIELDQTLGLMGDSVLDKDDFTQEAKEAIFNKGQSKRIWNELYKVIDSSDVILQVLDARNPLGTRCERIEKYIKQECPHKHLVFVVNKTDLVPTWVAAAWMKHLSNSYPTIAFHASIKNSFGKGSLISLLRQFATLHKDRKSINVGVIGFPNTGKSSIINTIVGKKACVVAPIPGATKVWQYVKVTSSINIIDSPGVVPSESNDSDADLLLRGVVRVEKVKAPEQYLSEILKIVPKKYIARTYGLKESECGENLLETLAVKSGRLLKGGEADESSVARKIIEDFIRGKLPWFLAPPQDEEVRTGEDKKAGYKKRKAED